MKKVFLPLILAVAFCVQAKVVKIELPVETAVYKPAVGAELANAQCRACHSADYSAMQPPKPRDFWKAEVEKMKGKYGAPISDDQTNALISYFASNYGTEKSATAGVVTTATPHANDKPVAIDAKQLAMKSGCFNCHQVKAKVIGPAYQEVAAKYAGHPEALAKISHQIINGGAGQWGPMPMPPFKQFSQEEIKALGEWILSLK